MRLASSVRAVCISVIALSAATASESAFAQAEPAPSQSEPEVEADQPGGEIIVTARRRNEDTMDVPVTVTAFSGAQLERAGVKGFADIARITPQLVVSTNVGTYAGFTALRGITSPTSNNAVDPAVLLVVNNVPVGTGAATRLGIFDVGQVEILKGPQALYFGKNATGGIISVAGALPTRDFELMLRGEYEFNADEMLIDGVVSGPLSDTLRGRVAVRRLTKEGDQFNNVPGAFADRGPDADDLSARGTVIFDPGSSLTVKATASYDRTRTSAPHLGLQKTFCPLGTPQGAIFPGDTDCTKDKFFTLPNLPLGIGTRSGSALFPDDGSQFARFNQKLFTLDGSFEPVEGVSLTSITGYYDLHGAAAGNYNRGIPVIMVAQKNRRQIFSEELRLASTDTAKAFSWMVGGFYQTDKLHDFEKVLFADATLTTLTNFPQSEWRVKGESFSGFAQASLRFLTDFSISAGARYTDETKKQRSNISNKFIPKRDFSDLSTEFTLSYKPHSDLNVFASYKEGYKSGSFQVSSIAFAALTGNPAVTSVDNSYDPETVSGFEAGVKTALLDRRLRLDFTAYTYTYKDLQLSALDPQTAVNKISNAGAARVRGAEFSANYSPASIDGLTLNTAVAFNDSKFKRFVGACYTGQSVAQGCTIDGPDAGTVPDLQDFAGRPLFKAPRWSATAGFDYSFDVGSDLRMGLDGRATYESKSFLTQEQIPWGIKPKTYLFDAGVRVGGADKAWEVALLGKNLTNKRYGTHGIQEFRTGSGTGTAAGVPADFVSYLTRGREIRLSLTLRPGAF